VSNLKKKFKYLALLGFSGDLLLNTLGIAAIVFGTQRIQVMMEGIGRGGGAAATADGAYDGDPLEDYGYDGASEEGYPFYEYEIDDELTEEPEYVAPEYAEELVEAYEESEYGGEYDAEYEVEYDADDGYGDYGYVYEPDDEPIGRARFMDSEDPLLYRSMARTLSDGDILEMGGGILPHRANDSCPNINADGNFILNLVVHEYDGYWNSGVICVGDDGRASSESANLHRAAGHLQAAWNDNAVRRIVMMTDVTLVGRTETDETYEMVDEVRIVIFPANSNGDSTDRNTPLEVDGNGRMAGRPSGLGTSGDGFILTRPASGLTLNLGISVGTSSTVPTVALPDDAGYFENGGGSLLHFHSVVIHGASTTGGGQYPDTTDSALINSSIPWQNAGTPETPQRRNRTGTWRFRFGNIRTSNVLDVAWDGQGRVSGWNIPGGGGPAIQRLVVAPQASVSFYGDVLLNTRRQNAIAGQILVEDGTLYVGNTSTMGGAGSPFYGIFWFGMRMHGQTTAAQRSCGRLTVPSGTDCSNSLVLGQEARVYTTSTITANTHSPMLTGFWRNLIIGEGASLETSQNAPAIGFNSGIANTGGPGNVHGATQLVRIHEGGRLVATRHGIGPVITSTPVSVAASGILAAPAQGARMEILEGAELHVIGSYAGGLINLTSGDGYHPNVLEINEGALADFQNLNTGDAAHLFQAGVGAEYDINHTGEVILWNPEGAMTTHSHFQGTLAGLGAYRRLVAVPHGTYISHVDEITEGDVVITGQVSLAQIPSGAVHGAIRQPISMVPLQGRTLLLNDASDGAWDNVYDEDDDEFVIYRVPGEYLRVAINADGSFSQAVEPQDPDAMVLLRLDLSDGGFGVDVRALPRVPQLRPGETYHPFEVNCPDFDPTVPNRNPMCGALEFGEEIFGMTYEELLDLGIALRTADGTQITRENMPSARGRVSSRMAQGHNSCPNTVPGTDFIIINTVVSGTMCVANDAGLPGNTDLERQANNDRGTGMLQHAWNNNAVRRIVLMDDITVAARTATGTSTLSIPGHGVVQTFPANSNGNAVTRTQDLEVDGNGRDPYGRPSGNGRDGDGFAIIHPGLRFATFQLAASPGAAGGASGMGATPADTVDFANGGGSLLEFHSLLIEGHGTFAGGDGATGTNAGSIALINSRVTHNWGQNNGSGIATSQNRHWAGTWRFRFGNIRTTNITVDHDPVTGRVSDWNVTAGGVGINRLARIPQAEATFYGDVLLSTRAQNFYLGKALFEDDSLYVGNVRAGNSPMFFFQARMHTRSTGSDRSCGNLTLPAERPNEVTNAASVTADHVTDCRNSFVMGRGARVYLSRTNNGATDNNYPVVYAYWRNLIVGDDARFEAMQPNPVLGFTAGIANTAGAAPLVASTPTINHATQTIRVHEGGTLMATRRNGMGYGAVAPTGNADTIPRPGSNGSVINSSTAHSAAMNLNNQFAQNALIDIMPGAHFYVIGSNNNSHIINLAGTNNTLRIREGAVVDIRNEAAGPQSRIFNRVEGANYLFEGRQDILLWTNGTGTGGMEQMNNRPPSFIFPQVDHMRITGVSGANDVAGINTSVEGLTNALANPGTVAGNTGTDIANRNTGRFRRIVTTTNLPTARLTDAVTDADVSIRGEVVLAQLPESIGVQNAVLGGGFRPLVAGHSGVRVRLYDTHHPDEPVDIPYYETINGSVPQPPVGYVQTDGTWVHEDPVGRFQERGNEVRAYAVRQNTATGAETLGHGMEYPVLDVTPPSPAGIATPYLHVASTSIDGTAPLDAMGVVVEISRFNEAAGAYEVVQTLSAEIYGAEQAGYELEAEEQESDDQPGAEQVWSVPIPEGTLQAGDRLQVLLHDGADQLTDADFDFPLATEGRRVPATHQAAPIGNQNPRVAALPYRDALFMVGPTMTVLPMEAPRNPDGLQPVVPLDPPQLHPGALRIDFASNFRFGEIVIGTGALSATAYPQMVLPEGADEPVESDLWVQVTDQRQNATGWRLHVEMDQPFSNGNHVLTGAQVLIRQGRRQRVYPWTESSIGEIPLRNIVVAPEERVQLVMYATGDERTGTHLASFDPAHVTFELPANTAVMPGDYQAGFRWTLSTTPLNNLE